MNVPNSPRWLPWAAAVVLWFGTGATSKVLDQRIPTLRAPLESAVPYDFGPMLGEDLELSDAEREVAGVTDYVMRVFEAQDSTLEAGAPWASVYVGYYESQTQGKTIHSPKNCLPGAGWQALQSHTVQLDASEGAPVQVNRYLLVNEDERVLVLYWYQGRGRVVASEYRAKWDLLRDASIKRRSDEALVRIVVPVTGSEDQAFEVARRLAVEIVPTLSEALPAA